MSKEWKPKYSVRMICETSKNEEIVHQQVSNFDVSDVALQRILGVQLMKYGDVHDMYEVQGTVCVDFQMENDAGYSKSTFIEYTRIPLKTEETTSTKEPAKNPEYLQKFVDAKLLNPRS